MSKRSTRPQRKLERQPQFRSRNKGVLSVLALSLLVTVGVMAHRGMLRNVIGLNAATTATIQSPADFSPDKPAKEYIYAGSRLLATEEPVLATAPPASPSNLRGVSPKGGFATSLSWTDNSTDETGFKLEHQSYTNGTWTQWSQLATIGANLTTYPIGAQNCDNNYRVRATNAGGDSAYSNVASPCTYYADGAPNQPPTVSLSAPASNATFASGSAPLLSANAGDADGTISKVEFFAGANKLGEVTAAPYNFIWRNVAAGNYSLTARATDDRGANTMSSRVNVDVNVSTPNSLSGNGTSDYLEVPNSPTINVTGAFTAEAWVRLNSSTGAYQSIFERYGQPDANGNNGGFYLRVKPDGKLEFVVNRSIQAGMGVQGNTLLTSGVWHHVAAVCDGSQMRIYLDGQLDATLNYPYLPTTGTTSLFVGSGNWGGGRINGLIDEARLTASALYTTDFTPESQLTSGPNTRGLWKFDNASASDFSGNGNVGLLRGVPTFSTTLPALANHCVAFNATGGRVNVANSQSLNITGPLTVETWFKINDNQTNQVLVGTQNGAGGFLLMANQGMPQFYVTQSAGVNNFAIAWPANITAGEWHHMAGVFDGGQLRIYLDGVLCASKNSTVAPGSVTTNLALGSYYDGSWGWLNGLLDEVRISVGALYTANFTPKRHLTATATTKGLWKFDGQTLQDASGNGNTGALFAGAAFSTNVP